MFKPIDYSTKKYHILKILHSMSVERYRHVMVEIPKRLSISNALWEKWMYLSSDDSYEISFSRLNEISQLLDVSVKTLVNYQPKQHQPIEIDKSQLTIFDNQA